MRSVIKRLARGALCAALVMILFLHGTVEAADKSSPVTDEEVKPTAGDAVAEPIITIGALEEPDAAANPMIPAGIGLLCGTMIAVLVLRKKRK